MNTLFIMGLETDQRLFEPLIKRLGGTCFNWIEPQKNESIKDYSRRFAEEISNKFHTSVNIVGLGFGGVIAMEVSRHIRLNSIAILNAPGDSKDIQDDFRKAVQVGSKMPLSMLKGLLVMKAASFYREKDNLTDEQFKLLDGMINKLDIKFLRWAALAAAGWDQPRPIEFDCPSLVLHGSVNKIIKRPKKMQHELLEGGGHLLALTHPDELSLRLEQFWKKIPD